MRNPFHYGGIVREENFCNRTEEQHLLLRAIVNGEKLFLYAERRMGKTSLVRRVLERAGRDGAYTVYVDLWPTESRLSFAATVASAITTAGGGAAQRLLRTARTLFSALAPSVTVDDEGKPIVTFGLSRGSEPEPILEQVLAAPAKIARRRKRPVVVVLDEFQRIAQYDDGNLERTLRSAIQNQEDVCYLFLGSRKHLMQQIFSDSARPLYRAAGHYHLTAIGADEWQPFITDRFEAGRKRISTTALESVMSLTEGHPFYVQHLCHALWERCEEGTTADESAVHEALDILLERESYAYSTVWEQLTVNQQRCLFALTAPTAPPPFSADFLVASGLRSPSSVQRALEALRERDIIDRNDDAFSITDRFFRMWIARTARGHLR